MADRNKKKVNPPQSDEERPAERHRAPTGQGRMADAPGATDKGGVVGIAGTGGSSGAGAAEVEIDRIGQVSGIDATEDAADTSDALDIAETESRKSGAASGHRRGTEHSGGMRGKLRGQGGEGLPNADDPQV